MTKSKKQKATSTNVATAKGNPSTRLRRFLGQPFNVESSDNNIQYILDWDAMTITVVIQRIGSDDALNLKVHCITEDTERYLDGKPQKPAFSVRPLGMSSISFEEMMWVTKDLAVLKDLMLQQVNKSDSDFNYTMIAVPKGNSAKDLLWKNQPKAKSVQ